ncbi:MAG: hypothetical protein QOG62_1643 [Thermoleophilaceae bacterium]|jgi:hypothetical protein|nr:hypothetical protein [Thermoleophilaceae bacterium]
MQDGKRRDNGPSRPTPIGRRRFGVVRSAPEERIGGRAWINGREVGGTDSRYLGLQRSHD